MNQSHFHTIPQNKAPQILNLIVEIQKGDSIKYEYDHELGILVCDRVLHGPIHFPVNYCDVPKTWNKHDNDPLDAVVFTKGNILPGTMVKGRVIGLMEMDDNGEMDNKIITVNDKDPRYNHVKDVNDLRPWDKKDLQTFFETYKYAQTGPGTVKVGEFLGKKAAYKLIEEAMEEYKIKFGKED
jgi:inorganic pyrophosphatase